MTTKAVNDFLDRLCTPGIYKVRITPDQAAALIQLDRNPRNRKLKPGGVNRFVRILHEDRWKLTNDAITVDINGDLANGQHRLHACARVKKPIEVLLMTGAPPDITDVIDTGIKRSLSDSLQIRGKTDTVWLSAGVTLHYRYTGAVRDSLTWTRMDNTKLDHPQMLDYLDDHPVIEASLPAARNAQKQLKAGQPAAWLAFVSMIYSQDEEAADEFMKRLKTGADLETGSPILALRNFLLRRETGHRSEKVLGMMVKAWNSWRRGKPMTNLTLRVDEKLPGAK